MRGLFCAVWTIPLVATMCTTYLVTYRRGHPTAPNRILAHSVAVQAPMEAAPAPAPREDRYVPPMAGGGGGAGGYGRDRPPPGSQWSGEGGGRQDAKGYQPQRAPSGRPHFGQDGRGGYGLGPGRDGSPGREEGGYGRPSGPGRGGMQGHRLRESDFPLEMGGTAKAEKPPQLRPRGKAFVSS